MSAAGPQRLMIFAKAPEPGRVKTRLAHAEVGGVGEAWACRLHEAFVGDVAERLAAEGRRRSVWRAGALEHPFWGSLGDVTLKVQGPGDLGQRMEAAFAEELAHGPVVVVGTDSPSMPPALVDEAFARLAEVPCVLGPACDGGYYLMGLNAPMSWLFHGVDWGTGAVLKQTLAHLLRRGVAHHLLPFWYDVDRPEDLALLQGHLPALSREGVAPPRTSALLERMEADGVLSSFAGVAP